MRMEVCLNQKSYGTESVRKARASFDNCGQGNLGEVPGIGVGMGGGGVGWIVQLHLGEFGFTAIPEMAQ